MHFPNAQRELIIFTVEHGDHEYVEYSWLWRDTSKKLDNKELVREVYGIDDKTEDNNQSVTHKKWDKWYVDRERMVGVHSVQPLEPLEFGTLLKIGLLKQ
tara:strand:+ start:486 stop:785 length:300 start_codon:yes stop_codon:yes gene_type:complete